LVVLPWSTLVTRSSPAPVAAAAPLLLCSIELHEDEVPDLHPALAVGRGLLAEGCGRRLAIAGEEVELGARTARTGLAHLPEVVARHPGDADDAVVGEAGDLLPDGAGLVVRGDARLPRAPAAEHGDDEALLVDAPLLRDELPREGDGVVLEVVTEAEVAEHLEERVVARSDADVLEVVVLARDADALLARRGARERAAVLADEDVLERDHARVREHQRRIVLRDERRGRAHLVALAGEEGEERRTDFGRGARIRAHDEELLYHFCAR
jgi:hypothetical protein